MRNGGKTWEYTSLEHSVKNLNLSPRESLPTLTGDELWRMYGPQNLQKAINFIDKVVKVQSEKALAMKKAL